MVIIFHNQLNIFFSIFRLSSIPFINMATAAVCITSALHQDKRLFFSLLAKDVVTLANNYTSPSLAINCRDTTGGELIVYQPLDGVSPVQTRTISGYSHCVYGFPVPYEWRQSRVTMTRRPLSRPSSVPDIVTLDYMQSDTARLRSTPTWADYVARDARDGPTVALSEQHVMLPLVDDGFWVCDTVTGSVMPTSMVFGARNRALGNVRLAARDYTLPGMALIAGTGNHMIRYCAWTNTTQHVSLPVGTPSHERVSCVLCVPNSSTFLVGVGSRLSVYDFRQSHEPAQAVTARYALWPSAAMFSEHAVASWNSLSMDADGTWAHHRHCQTCDLRAPTQWDDRPEWNLPTNTMPLWTSPLVSTPRIT